MTQTVNLAFVNDNPDAAPLTLRDFGSGRVPVTAPPFKAATNGTTDARAAIVAAATSVGTRGRLVLPAGTYRISATGGTTLAITCPYEFEPGAELKVDSGVTVNFSGLNFTGRTRCVAASSQGTVILSGSAHGNGVFPQWWGAVADADPVTGIGTDNTAAFQAAHNAVKVSGVNNYGTRYNVDAGPGDFAFASQLIHTAGAEFKGMGRGTTRLHTNFADFAILTQWQAQRIYNNYLHDFDIVCHALGGSGIKTIACIQFTIERVNVQGQSDAGNTGTGFLSSTDLALDNFYNRWVDCDVDHMKTCWHIGSELTATVPGTIHQLVNCHGFGDYVNVGLDSRYLLVDGVANNGAGTSVIGGYAEQCKYVFDTIAPLYVVAHQSEGHIAGGKALIHSAAGGRCVFLACHNFADTDVTDLAGTGSAGDGFVILGPYTGGTFTPSLLRIQGNKLYTTNLVQNTSTPLFTLPLIPGAVFECWVQMSAADASNVARMEVACGASGGTPQFSIIGTAVLGGAISAFSLNTTSGQVSATQTATTQTSKSGWARKL